MNNHESSPVELLDDGVADEVGKDETAAKIVEMTPVEVSPERKQEIINNAYRKVGNKTYTKSEWEERKNQIVQKVMKKGEFEAKVEPESKPVPSQLDVALARAKKIELENILENKPEVEKAPQETPQNKETTGNNELLNILNNQVPPEKLLNPKKPKNTEESLHQKKELLGTLDKVFEKGEKVMVSGESGVWQVVEYFSEIGEYDLTNDNKSSIHKFNAKKVYQTRSKMNSWLSKTGKSIKNWFGFGKEKKSGDRLFPRS